MVVQRGRDFAYRARASVAFDEELSQESEDQRGVAGAQQPPSRMPLPQSVDPRVVHLDSVSNGTDGCGRRPRPNDASKVTG